jgi:hypothetical protein
MYHGMAAAADSTTQAQNQSIPDFVRGYNKQLRYKKKIFQIQDFISKLLNALFFNLNACTSVVK